MKILLTLLLVSLVAVGCNQSASKDQVNVTQQDVGAEVEIGNNQISTPDQVIPQDVLPISAQNAPMNVGETREVGIKAGAKFGYIRVIQNLTAAQPTIIFDEAQFLNQEEAQKMGKSAPSGFSIYNPSTATKNYVLAKQVTVRLIVMGSWDSGVGVRIGSLTDLQAMAGAEGRPVWLSFSNGQVSDIEEQYLP